MSDRELFSLLHFSVGAATIAALGVILWMVWRFIQEPKLFVGFVAAFIGIAAIHAVGRFVIEY